MVLKRKDYNLSQYIIIWIEDYNHISISKFHYYLYHLSGVAVPYDELVKTTTSAILDLVDEKEPGVLDQFTSLLAVYKDGADGSGSQAVMKSSAMFDMAENIYQHAIVPLRLEGTNR